MKRFTKFISETPENRASLKEYDTHDDFDKQDKLPNPVHDHKWRQVGSVRKVDGKYHGFHYGTNKYVGSADTSAEAKQAVLDAHEKHTKSLKEEVEQTSKQVHISVRDHVSNVYHIRRDSDGNVTSHNHSGSSISLANHAFNLRSGTAEKSAVVKKIIKDARDSNHAAELMNSSNLGHTNWKAHTVSEEVEQVVGESSSDHWDEAEEHLKKAKAAEAKGNKSNFHFHMADHHNALVQWHEGKGRHNIADKHAEKSEQHHEKAVEHLKEEIILERGEDSKGYKRSTESGAGLTRKGAKHFGVKTAVTGKVKPGSKAAKRRKSFCARMSGMKGPMKDEKGRPTRKAMSLRRWRCRE